MYLYIGHHILIGHRPLYQKSGVDGQRVVDEFPPLINTTPNGPSAHLQVQLPQRWLSMVGGWGCLHCKNNLYLSRPL